MSTTSTRGARFRRWGGYRAIPVAAVLAGVLAFLGSFAISNKYLATTQLLVRNNTSYLANTASTDQNMPELGSTDLATALSDTQTALTSSQAVASAVVAKLHLDATTKSHHGVVGAVKSTVSGAYHDTRALLTYGSIPKVNKHDAAVNQVQQSLSATQIKTSYVIEIGATWSDPKTAAAIANAAADALVDQSKARYAAESAQYIASLKNQLDKASQAQTAAEQALSSYETAHGITDLDQQLLVTAQNTTDMQQQITTLNAQVQNLTAELTSVEASLAKTPTTSTNSQTVQTGRSSTDITSTAPNALYQSLATQAANLRAQIDGDNAQRDAITQALAGAPTQSGPLTATQAQSSKLALESTVASNNFQALSQQYQQAVLAGNQSNIEVTRIDTASPPALPVSPVRYMYLLVGLVLGALISFIVVHARALRRARLAAADGVADGTGVGADGTGVGADGAPILPAQQAAHRRIDLSALDSETQPLVTHGNGGSANGHVASVADGADNPDRPSE